MLRYRKIPLTMFTDISKSSVKSERQNQHPQMYSTNFIWIRASLMKKEVEACHTLFKLFKDIRVPDTMVIMDGAKNKYYKTLGVSLMIWTAVKNKWSCTFHSLTLQKERLEK